MTIGDTIESMGMRYTVIETHGDAVRLAYRMEDGSTLELEAPLPPGDLDQARSKASSREK